ncbi:MAG: hypothetical protein MR809_02565 [Rikenellaceae bacterium]|nr:hypothetical protein [Rikenellaceae bacterium]
MNARFSLGAKFNVITRPKGVAEGIYIYSLEAVVLAHVCYICRRWPVKGIPKRMIWSIWKLLGRQSSSY